MNPKPKYRVTVVHPKWWDFDRSRVVTLEKFDGRSRKYKAVSTTQFGVRDARRN
jgi:hypothetical protein